MSEIDVFKSAEVDVNQPAAVSQEGVGAVVEITPPAVLSTLERAQIDTQISTARQFPRMVSQSIEKAKSLVCSNSIIAASCRYSFPRGGKDITGDSIRLAEAMATSWGNLRYGGRIVEVGQRTVTAQGVCHDLESNAAVSVEAVRSIIDSDGHRYSEDMIRVTCMAAIAIAVRNAIFAIIPKGYVDQVARAAQKVARGEEKGLEVRRADALGFFTEQGIPQEKVFIALGVAAAEDITWNHIDRLLRYATAISVEGVSPETIFGAAARPAAEPPPSEPTEPPKTYEDAIMELGAAGCSWEQLYAAVGLSDSSEMTEAHKLEIVKLAKRLQEGESLEQILAAPPQSPTPGPPAGDQAFGSKAAAQGEKPTEQNQTPPATSKDELDF